MTQKEKEIVLKECEAKIGEVNLLKALEECGWENTYNRNYKVSFTLNDKLNKVVCNPVVGIIVVCSAMFLSSKGCSLALTFSPVGAYTAVGLGTLLLSRHNRKKRKDYNGQLQGHQQAQSNFEKEIYGYSIIKEYLKSGDKYLLSLYCKNLEATMESEETDDMGYLNIDVTRLTPLMIKVLKEMKSKTIQLRDNIRREILEDIGSMHAKIAEDDSASVPKLKVAQKMLKSCILSSSNEAIG